MSAGGGGERSGATGMAWRHSGPATRDELAPGVLMRALGVGVTDEGAAAGERADPPPSAARARLAGAAAVAGTALLAGVLGPGAGAGQNSVESRSNVPAVAGAAGSVETQGDSFVKTRKFGSDVVLGAAAAAAVSMSALAGDAVQWRVEDGGNGHWYFAYVPQGSPCFASRATDASRRGGHLATINLAGEQKFIRDVAEGSAGQPRGYIGGLRQPASDVNTGWSWITGEPFNNAVVQWAPGNPGCCDPNEFWLMVTPDVPGAGYLHDVSDCSPLATVVEWDADCNSDGIVDYGQILSGSLADANANGVPDGCECATNPGLPTCCIGDIVNDGAVNGADLGTLLAYWGPVTSGAFSIASDLNSDGRVDGSDLGTLLAYWGMCPGANVPTWATVVEALPDPNVVTDSALRAAIIATGRPWRVRDTATQIEMLLVPPGTFEMGCSRSTEFPCYELESPNHSVTLTKSFYLARFELTQQQWTAKMTANPSRFQGYSDSALRPVESVSWTRTQDFLLVTGLRLPSEAEWEFACRAGTSTAFSNGTNDDSTVSTIAWYAGNSGGQTHAVGGKLPNALGFYDMHGNVHEWVNDWQAAFEGTAQIDPQGPSTGTYRVNRGGSCYVDSTQNVRSSFRPGGLPGNTWPNVGFRVARNP